MNFLYTFDILKYAQNNIFAQKKLASEFRIKLGFYPQVEDEAFMRLWQTIELRLTTLSHCVCE